MTLNDTKENTSIEYLFIKDWKWIYAGDMETHVGHPKPGRIYRAGLNKDTKMHRMFFKLPNAANYTVLLIPDLKAGEEENHQYESNIVTITKENLLSLDIVEEDLNELVSWIAEDNKTIKQIMGLNRHEVTPDEIVKSIMANNVQIKTDEEFVGFIRETSQLRENDSILFEGIYFLTEWLNREGKELNDDSGLEFSKNLGAGSNIGKVQVALNRYASENHRISLDPNDLLLAIRSLLIEYNRAIFHGQ